MERLLAIIGTGTVIYGAVKLFNLMVSIRVAQQMHTPPFRSEG